LEEGREHREREPGGVPEDPAAATRLSKVPTRLKRDGTMEHFKEPNGAGASDEGPSKRSIEIAVVWRERRQAW